MTPEVHGMRMIAMMTALLLTACGSSTPTGATCSTRSTLTYDTFGRPFFARYCDRCHALNEQPSLRTQAQIQTNRAWIDTVAAAGPNASNGSMPMGGATPTAAERLQLGEWLACGAP